MAKHRRVQVVSDTASWLRVGQRWVVCATSVAVGLGLAGLVGSGVAPANADASYVSISGGFAERPGTTDNDDDPDVDVSDDDTPNATSDGPRRNVLRGGTAAGGGADGPRVLINGQNPTRTASTDDDESSDESGTAADTGGNFGGGQLPAFLSPDSDSGAATAEPTIVEKIQKFRSRVEKVKKLLGLAAAIGGAI